MKKTQSKKVNSKLKLKEQIISDLTKGIPSEKIAKKRKVSKMTVAAYKAHITMGTY